MVETYPKCLIVEDQLINTKQHLLPKGFTQNKGVDYFDAYAPIARLATIRVLIALASINKLVIHQIDAKLHFLHGELDEKVLYETT